MPKKQVKNGFYYFMKAIEPDLRREGRQFPNGMADVVVVAHPRWKQLPQKERDRYETMAKREKARLRGQAGDQYRVDNLGNTLATRKDKYTEYEKRRMAERKDIVKNWPAGKAMKQETFYFINFQYLCVTDEGEYLPAEIAAIEYSLEKGITKQLHRFIEPGQIPTGYRFTCVQNSDETHKIPVEGFHLADSNYTGLWIQLKNFINPSGEKPEYPPLYCLGATNNYLAVEGCLDWIHRRACMGEPNVFHKVYEVESLFKEMFAHVGKQVSKTQCVDRLSCSDWDYHPKTRCPYHEELEVKDCALGVVNRYAYVISDTICPLYDVHLTPTHVPPTDELDSITVLSPSSMPVCPNQEARMPQKSDYFQKSKPQKARQTDQEDYTQLRRPKPLEPQYPAPTPVQTPAWGGATGGGHGAMGGVNGAVGGVNTLGGPLGRGGLPLGRASALAPAPDVRTDDFPPMPGGRGLSVRLQDLSLNQKPAGRGGLLNHQPESQAPPMWQQPPTISSLQAPGGVGRGNLIRPPAMAPSPVLGNTDDDMLPLRRPGQPVSKASQVPSASIIPTQQQSAPSQSYHQPQDSSYTASTPSQESSYPAVGRGRGGILEDLLKNGVKPGVPCGRGLAPPDIVEKIRLAR